MTSEITLYCMARQDRSDRVRWLLEEIGLPYQDRFLDRSRKELDTPAYRRLNPMGRVPTLVDGDIVIHESAAICLYLADRYGYGKLAPVQEQVAERALYLQWSVFSVGTLEAVVARMFTERRNREEALRTEAFVAEQCATLKLVLKPVLARQEYILASGFSAADILLAAVIPGAHTQLVEGEPEIEAYMERLMKRDAAVRAQVFG